MAKTYVSRRSQRPGRSRPSPRRDPDHLPTPSEYHRYQDLTSNPFMTAAEAHEIIVREFPGHRERLQQRRRERRERRQARRMNTREIWRTEQLIHDVDNFRRGRDFDPFDVDTEDEDRDARELRRVTDEATARHYRAGEWEKVGYMSDLRGERTLQADGNYGTSTIRRPPPTLRLRPRPRLVRNPRRANAGTENTARTGMTFTSALVINNAAPRPRPPPQHLQTLAGPAAVAAAVRYRTILYGVTGSVRMSDLFAEGDATARSTRRYLPRDVVLSRQGSEDVAAQSLVRRERPSSAARASPANRAMEDGDAASDPASLVGLMGAASLEVDAKSAAQPTVSPLQQASTRPVQTPAAAESTSARGDGAREPARCPARSAAVPPLGPVLTTALSGLPGNGQPQVQHPRAPNVVGVSVTATCAPTHRGTSGSLQRFAPPASMAGHPQQHAHSAMRPSANAMTPLAPSRSVRPTMTSQPLPNPPQPAPAPARSDGFGHPRGTATTQVFTARISELPQHCPGHADAMQGPCTDQRMCMNRLVAERRVRFEQ